MRGRPASLAALATAVLAAAAAAIVPPSSSADRVALQGPGADLRAQSADLAHRSRSAVLELYALETRVDAARAAQAREERRVAAIRRERDAVRERALIARRTVAVAQRRLGERLRALYEEGELDALAILLGADSIEEALAGLDGLQFTARQDREIVTRTAATRRALTALERKLAIRAAAAQRAVAAAAARTAELERAVSARREYVRRLEREQRLRRAQIEQVEAQARAARTRTQALVADAPDAAAPAPTAAAPPATPAPVATEGATGTRTLTVISTGYALPGRTATGIPVAWGVVAVDPSVIPLGTRMTIPGYGEGVAADTGSAVIGAHIDLWFPSTAQALQWGRRTVTITLH